MGTPCATRRRAVVAIGIAAALGVVGAAGAMRAEPEPPEPGVKSFEVTASRFKFEPALFEVTEGDTVVLTVHSLDTIHGLEIKALGVKLVVPKGGEPVQVRFQAARAGTFDIACSEYCGSGHRRMKAQLVVGPAGPAAPAAPKASQ